MHTLVLLCINQHTKFEMPNFSDSIDMIGGPKFLKKLDHITLILTALIRSSFFQLYHPKSNTGHIWYEHM